MSLFKLSLNLTPQGDQPQAIKSLLSNFHSGQKAQTLLGVTGSGKTFTVANVIAGLDKPVLVLAPNKTLAAQLYSEFKEFFPDNAVEYFVSYYDYYQPEAYVPGRDVYIEKDASINDEIDKLRHSATRSILERKDVIVVASVSCIYGIGSPSEYASQKMTLFLNDELVRDDLLKRLVEIQYKRNDIDFTRGAFRVRGDIVEVFPAHEDSSVIRIEFFGDEIDSISLIDPLRATVLQQLNKVTIYPSSHYVVSSDRLKDAIEGIKIELREQIQFFEQKGKLVEAERIKNRTMLDLEMLEEMGFCQGIENYSRHLTGAKPGEPPPTLIDYFKRDFIMVIDESHITIPQVGGMYRGDRARKMNLVEFGFRLPSALDNRPLNFTEFENRLDLALMVSATPGEYELKKTNGEYVEQVIRPTGLVDPQIEIRDATSQVDNLLVEVRKVIKLGYRVLITTLTKKMAEELTSYYSSLGLNIRYLHSDIDAIERVEIIRDLRLGNFDILVGINLLREGLDLPEVALVAIMDADKEGFLRSTRSLIQTIGRAARNQDGRVILYSYKITPSMQQAIDVTNYRRHKQIEHNKTHGIEPKTINKKISAGVVEALRGNKPARKKVAAKREVQLNSSDIEVRIKELKQLMHKAAGELKFEEAARLRDEIKELNQMFLLA